MRRPPRSTLDRSSAASDVYKRQGKSMADGTVDLLVVGGGINGAGIARDAVGRGASVMLVEQDDLASATSVSYTHLRAHETVLDLVCRLLLEKKKTHQRAQDFPTYS